MDALDNHPVLGPVILLGVGLLLGGLWTLLSHRLTKTHILLPHVRVRRLWLRRALRDYPLYDPPHKVEEYRLSKKQAGENFAYFMRVRQQRVAYFREWLRRNFGVTVALNENGVRALNRWGNKYAALLLVRDRAGDPTDSYFTYDPPWTGGNAGYNALFDMGITVGEIMIVSCPKLRWALEPTAALLPRTAKLLKQTPGMSFQRPKLTGFEDPTGEVSPLHEIHGFAHQMLYNMITFKGVSRYWSRPRASRKNVRDELLNYFHGVLRNYLVGDPDSLRHHMPPEEYLKFIDRVGAEELEEDE